MKEKTVNRARIVSQLGKKSKLHRTDIAYCVASLLELMIDVLESGQSIKIPHFGTFNVRHKSARPGRNPRTGEPVEINPRRVTTFRPSQTLRNRLQEKHKPSLAKKAPPQKMPKNKI